MKNYLLDVLERPSIEVAPRLLGSLLVRKLNGKLLVGRIVETEAYDQNDAASHSYNGQTMRNSVMFGPAGFAYVYFTHGMHHCFNISTDKLGVGSAVLIRAIEPLEGQNHMVSNRHGLDGVATTNGPAKLCQALSITKRLDGHDMHKPPLELILEPPVSKSDIILNTRIGIKKSVDELRRFYLIHNQYVSRP